MKTLSKIITVLLVLVLVVVLVIGVLEMPVAEEGEQLTKAQEVIVLLKNNLTAILSSVNLTLGAFVLTIFNILNKQSNGLLGDNKLVQSTVNSIAEQVDNGGVDVKKLITENAVITQKLDILTDLFTSTLLLSDLPQSVRVKISDMLTKYTTLSTSETTPSETPLVEAVSEVVETLATTEPATPNDLQRY